jgi:hypothetical protein
MILAIQNIDISFISQVDPIKKIFYPALDLDYQQFHSNGDGETWGCINFSISSNFPMFQYGLPYPELDSSSGKVYVEHLFPCAVITLRI